VARKPKKTPRKEQVPVYFTPEEKKQIMKRANKAVLGTSPFLRKHIIESLQIQTVEA
jgi:hypothetical protein